MKVKETIYGEIVGWTGENGSSIMSPHSIDKISDKKLRKNLKKVNPDGMMYYSYGCNRGETKFFVYRITQTEEEGKIRELKGSEYYERAKELELEICPVFEVFSYQGKEDLIARIENYFKDVIDPTDSRHIKEGVVIRVDAQSERTFALKDKTKLFKYLEGISKEDPTMIDMEESS